MLNSKQRNYIQWSLVPITFIVIGLGWRYPILGFIVPLTMITGIIVSLFNSRYACGNICPRGAFLDRIIEPITPNRSIPQFFRNMTFRWSVLIVLMGLMVYRLAQNIGSWEHWGKVFWLMCTITTVLGIILALFTRARTWCTFCPIGTLGNIFGNKEKNLKLNSTKCIGCKLCEKTCPMNLKIISKNKELIPNNDCIKCGACVTKCPRQALKFL